MKASRSAQKMGSDQRVWPCDPKELSASALGEERRVAMELASDGKDVASPVHRGASVKSLCPGVWRTPKLKNTARNEDVLAV